MAFFEDMFKGGNIVTALAIGVGAAVLAPVIAPAVSTVVRPAAKALIKGGIVVYDWARQAAAQVSEAASDMAAEARAETHPAEATTGPEPASAEVHPA
jgi:hypothetical protein